MSDHGKAGGFLGVLAGEYHGASGQRLVAPRPIVRKSSPRRPRYTASPLRAPVPQAASGLSWYTGQDISLFVQVWRSRPPKRLLCRLEALPSHHDGGWFDAGPDRIKHLEVVETSEKQACKLDQTLIALRALRQVRHRQNSGDSDRL